MEPTVHSAPAEPARPWPQSVSEFEAVVDAFQHRLVQFAFCRLHSVADAQDVVQDVLVQAYRDRRKHKAVDNAGPFLFRMVANRCTDVLRRRRRQAGSLDEVELPAAASADSMADAAEVARRLRRVEALLAKLPPRQAEVIRLRVCGELPFDAVARALGCSVSTVKSRFRYGVEKLRRVLKGQRGEQ